MTKEQFTRKAKLAVGRGEGWQTRIAVMLGCHRSAISRWAGGQKIPVPIQRLLTIYATQAVNNAD